MAKKKGERCPTCGSIISPYIFRFDIADAQLLLAMARSIRTRFDPQKRNFTEANHVHVPTLDASDAVRHRTTQASKLGLVAKALKNGKHVPGTWVITARGWAALRGEPVPEMVEVFRKNITERTDKTITIGQIARTAQRKFEPQEWIEFSEKIFIIQEGKPVEKKNIGSLFA